MKRKLYEIFLRVMKGNVQLEYFIVLNLPTSKYILTLVSTVILQKKPSLSRSMKVHKYHFCHQIFDGFFSLHLHRQKMHNAQSVSETKDVDLIKLLEEIDNETSEEKLETCSHYRRD